MSRRSPAFDVSGVVWEWLNRRGVSDKERMTLMAEIRAAIGSSSNARALLAEMGQEAVAQKLNPVSVIALGLNYGAAIGTMMEQSATRSEGELLPDEAIHCWLACMGISSVDRRELLLTLQRELQHSNNAQRFIHEIADEAMVAQLGAVDLMMLALNYGLVLGVLLERERFERYLRRVV